MKKKLLTLTFTLILLIGLVAAVGMNASAADVTCTANGNIYEVNDGDYLRYYLSNADDGDTIRLTDDIVFQNASGNFEIEPMFNSSKGGNVILDLNGNGLYVAAKNSYLFDLAEVQDVSLHIVDNDPQYEGWIQFISPQIGSSVFYLGSSNNKLYIYEGVSVTMGKANTAVSGSQATYIINASSYGEIGIHGAYLQNLYTSGEGLYFNNNTIGMRSSKVYIDGGTEIKTNSSCIDLHNTPYYPDFQIGAAILDGNNAIEVIDDNQYANTTETALKFKDLLQDGYNLFMVDGSSVDNMNSASLLYNNDTADCHIYKDAFGDKCTTHESKKDIFVHAGGHLTQCTDCGYSAGTTLHTQVTVKEATCTRNGYSKAGYDCACGRLNATVIPALGHDFYTVKAKEPTCTESGTTSDYQKCTRCAGRFTMGGNAFGGAKWAAIYRKALGHDMKAVAAVAATCTKDGNIAHYDCSRCDHKSSDAAGNTAITNIVVAKKAHTYKNVTTKATLTKNGKVENKCSVCGNVSNTTTIYYPKTIKLSATAYTYNKKVKTPTVTVKDSKGNTLKKDTDYTVKYASGRKSTGKYSVTITFKGKYSGTKTLYFNILPSKTSKITPTCSTTEIKASWKKVTGASGYKVELLNSKGKVVKKVTTTKTSYTFKKLSKVTTYKIRVTAYKTIDKKAAYSTVSTTIITSTAPAKTTLSKVTAGSKSATPAWKTVSGASGYEVQYSTSSKFKSAKTATVKKGSSKKTTIKKLTKGKKYYFKVRAYKTVDGKKVYGAWSSVKTVKVK